MPTEQTQTTKCKQLQNGSMLAGKNSKKQRKKEKLLCACKQDQQQIVR